GRPITSLACGGKTIVAGRPDCIVTVGDEGSGFTMPAGFQHRAPLDGLAVSADGRLLASVANLDGSNAARLSHPDGRHRANLVGHQGWINGVTFTPEGRVAAWGPSGVTAWNLAGQKLFSILDPTWKTAGAVLSADGKTLVLLTESENVKLHDFQTGKELGV